MKKTLTLLALSLSLTALSACSNKKKEANPPSAETQLDTQIVKKDTTPAHQDIRLKFNEIKLATAAEEFVGGTNLETLKSMFGEPAGHETVPAGDVSVDLYHWNFDQVTLRVHLYQDSSIVRSISNFQFNREQTITKSDIATLKVSQGDSKGDSFKTISDRFGQPDIMSQAMSSEKEEIEAIWTSGLKTDKGATLILYFENNHLTRVQETGVTD